MTLPAIGLSGVVRKIDPIERLSIGEIKDRHSQLYNKEFLWEKIWTTTNKEYGEWSEQPFIRPITNKSRRETLWRPKWSTTYSEIGKQERIPSRIRLPYL